MARQMADVVYDLRGGRCDVAYFNAEEELDNLAFTPDGKPTYTAHQARPGSLVTFLVDPEPVEDKPTVSAYRFGLA